MQRLTALCRTVRALLMATLAGSVGTQAQAQLDPDNAAWEAARAVGTAEACQAYLEQYPTGRYAEDAFRCIVEATLGAAPGAAPAAPAVDLY